MTKELKQKAREYIKVNNLEWELECHRTSPIREVEQAYIAGATEATKELQEATIKFKSDYHELCNLQDMRIAELEKQLNEAKKIIEKLLKYIFTPEGFEELDKDMIMETKAFLKE